MRLFKGLAVPVALVALIALAVTFGPSGAASAAHGMPATGWTVHIDAQKHFPNHPNEWAHHWCRPVSGVPGMLECQIYPSDASNAAMVATEVIVPPGVWKKMSASERATWHYHKTEIAKVNMKMPDVSAAVAKKTAAQIGDTYGKIYVLWDPMDGKGPVGPPGLGTLGSSNSHAH